MEDWDLYLRLAESHHFAPVKEILVGYRQSCGSSSRDYESMAQAHAAMSEGARRRNPKLPGWLYRLSQSSLYIYFAGRQRSE